MNNPITHPGYESFNAGLGYMRLREVLRLIPVSKTVWWEGCKTGQYPKPYKIGLRATGWKVEDIHRCMRNFKSI